MLYVKRAKFSTVPYSYGLSSVLAPKYVPKYSNITIASTKAGKCKRISFEEFKQLYLAGEPWTRSLVGVCYDKYNDRFTFAEVDPDDWKEYHTYYELVDDTQEDTVKFCGGFSFILHSPQSIKAAYRSDFSTDVSADVSNKGGGKNYVRLEKGFIIYNDEIYARKTNECEEFFDTLNERYCHTVVYHTKTGSSYVWTTPNIEGIESLQDLAFNCRYRHQADNTTVESYFLINDTEYNDALFNTKYGWSVPAKNGMYDGVPYELATVQNKGKSFAVLKTHRVGSTYISIQDVNDGGKILLHDARMAMVTPIPIIIVNDTIITPVHEKGFLSRYEDNKVYFGYQGYNYQVLELEVIDGFGIIRCVPRYKKTSDGAYDLLYGTIKPEGIDFDKQKKALGLDALGDFDIEEYRAYIQSQSAYIRREALKCRLADVADANVWLLREINRLPATNLYFKFAHHKDGSGFTLLVSKDGKYYTDTMRYNANVNNEYRTLNGIRTYLSLRLSASGEAQVGIALVSNDDDYIFFRLEYLFDIEDTFDENFYDCYFRLNNKDILKELDNGYIRGNLLQRV